MENTRMPRQMLDGKPESRRSHGRPKLRWFDGVERDLKIIGVRNWKEKSLNRAAWRDLLDQAKALPGL